MNFNVQSRTIDVFKRGVCYASVYLLLFLCVCVWCVFADGAGLRAGVLSLAKSEHGCIHTWYRIMGFNHLTQPKAMVNTMLAGPC